MKRNIFFTLFLLVIIFTGNTGNCQLPGPSVVFQTGFYADISTQFEISPQNNFLFGYNDIGEFILWDLKSSKQVKKFNLVQHEVPAFIYFPQPSIHRLENFILIPQRADGSYTLYDIKKNHVVNVFTPKSDDEYYTHAIFSELKEEFLLISQNAGNDKYCSLELINCKGVSLKKWEITVPPQIKNKNTQKVVKLLLKNAGVPAIQNATADEDLSNVYMSHVLNKLLVLNLHTLSSGDDVPLSNPAVINEFERKITSLKVYNNKLIAKEDGLGKRIGETLLRTEKINIISLPTLNVERSIEASVVFLPEKYKSNSIACKITTTNHSMRSYLQVEEKGENDFILTAKDIITDKKLFSYKSGEPFAWYKKTPYKLGQLNGGFVMDISSDGKLMVECTKELLIHNVVEKNIKNEISISHGNIKLNSPVFIDSTSFVIPKITNDAFIVDLKNLNISKLDDQIACLDTLRDGVNMVVPLRGEAFFGLNNVCLSTDKKLLFTTNFVPNTLCNPKRNKTIEVWDLKSKLKKKSYYFDDDEHTYHFELTPEERSFLVNFKLLKFENDDFYSIKELRIKSGKEDFFAYNPTYLPESKTIFSLMATRTKPGDPDLMFAHFNLNGDLISSYRYPRKKGRLEFHSLPQESVLSPDKTKLLFCLVDGTAGIYDIKLNKVTSTYIHGTGFFSRIFKNMNSHTNIVSACFIDDGHFLTSGDDGQIYEWSIGRDKPDRKINQEFLTLFSSTMSPDRKYIVGTTLDKTVKFIDFKTGLVKASFVGLDHETYALINSDGYYMSNKKSSNDLWFFFNGKTYEFSQFDLNFNRPDKVFESIGYASKDFIEFYKRAYEKRLKRLNYKPSTFPGLSSYNAPSISLLGLPDNLQFTNVKDFKFGVKVTDNLYPIDKIFITVNGVPFHGTKGLNVSQLKVKELTKTFDIDLEVGVNNITISAMNSMGVESLRETINVTRRGQKTKPNAYIVTIGSGRFVEESKNLTYPSKDANDVANLFSGNNLFNKVYTKHLTDSKVTRANILSIRNDLAKAQTEDYIIFYYAGHGLVDQKLDYYLSTYNTNFNNPNSTAISYDEIDSLLDNLPSRNKIIFIDACHSGEIDKEEISTSIKARTASVTAPKFRSNDNTVIQNSSFEEKSSILMNSLFTDIRRTNGASIIAASGNTQYALEDHSWNNGAFTYCLKRGLKEKNADLNKNGEITVSELIQYLRLSVAEITSGQQLPTSRTENLIKDFVIWK